MIYRFEISTPANTAETAKQKTDIICGRGIVHQLDCLFPPGPAGLLHIQIKRGLHQVWPSNAESDFAIDHNVISFREHYELLTRPYQFEVYSWNLDDSYPHSVFIRIGILERKFILRRFI